ncbi:MAG TPA: AAA family ATPase [Micromonosporaceae bacterium]|jgi:energy-coupling factor transporter ATP-binding protein EcfA2
MTAMLPTSAEASRVVEAVLADLRMAGPRGVVVDSPPGAGKSTLVVRAAGTLVDEGSGQVMVVAQTNEQVDDLVYRLATGYPGLTIGRLSAQDYLPTPRVVHDNVMVEKAVAKLVSAAIVVATAAKWTTVSDGTWPWAIVDEAYQMRSDTLLRIANRFDRALFVGDPGQLDPFSTVETNRWTGLTWDPMQSAVAALLRHNPDLPLHRLPVSWRLPASAAPAVSAAFYPFTPFVSGTGPGERTLSLRTAALRSSPVDGAIEAAVDAGWSLFEMPNRHALRTDAEAVAACATIAQRLLERGPLAFTPDGLSTGEPVTPSRIAIGTAHRDQAAAIRAQLGALGSRTGGITVDTANRLQGREYDVTIVLHPLSGRLDATAFHLESGRLCVLTSRHRHACIVVARAGIQELLDAHPSTEPVHLSVPVKFPDGWEANQSILTHLQPYKVRAP